MTLSQRLGMIFEFKNEFLPVLARGAISTPENTPWKYHQLPFRNLRIPSEKEFWLRTIPGKVALHSVTRMESVDISPINNSSLAFSCFGIIPEIKISSARLVSRLIILGSFPFACVPPWQRRSNRRHIVVTSFIHRLQIPFSDNLFNCFRGS